MVVLGYLMASRLPMPKVGMTKNKLISGFLLFLLTVGYICGFAMHYLRGGGGHRENRHADILSADNFGEFVHAEDFLGDFLVALAPGVNVKGGDDFNRRAQMHFAAFAIASVTPECTVPTITSTLSRLISLLTLSVAFEGSDSSSTLKYSISRPASLPPCSSM